MTKDEQIKFLNEEIKKEIRDFEEYLYSPALSLHEQEELFIGQFINVNEKGQLIIGFPTKKGIPRKGEILLGFLLPGSLCDYSKWGRLTYKELFLGSIIYSELHLIWTTSGKSPDTIIAGFSRMSIDFFERLNNDCIIVLGPNEPPIQYLKNLITFLNHSSNELLNLELGENNWQPVLIDNNPTRPKFYIDQLSLTDTLVIQGPPGTGKTTLVARICRELVSNDLTVLVTTLTNRALMEVAGHEDLEEIYKLGKILKTNLSFEEKSKYGKINNISGIKPISGKLILGTFYMVSNYIKSIDIHSKFDYLIIDEASQALLPTFCLFQHFSKKSIWIGDHKQLPPVVNLNRDDINRLNGWHLVRGFENICLSGKLPGYLMNETYRFSERAVGFTGSFYRGQLVALRSDRTLPDIDIKEKFKKTIHTQGGPSLVMLDLPMGETAPATAMMFIKEFVEDIHSHYNFEIAILTPYRKTVKALQKKLNPANNLLTIDTIDRSQGLNTDISVFLICNVSFGFALEETRFNVATSRARYNTIIIADPEIYNNLISEEIRLFFSGLEPIRIE